MKLGLGPLRQLRHLERYREILRVLIKYGFAQVLDELHLYGLRERIFARGRKKADGAAPQTMEARLRMALTELGPAFVKLGQLLSTRADLLPPSFIEELSRLQDRVPLSPRTRRRPYWPPSSMPRWKAALPALTGAACRRLHRPGAPGASPHRRRSGGEDQAPRR